MRALLHVPEHWKNSPAVYLLFLLSNSVRINEKTLTGIEKYLQAKIKIHIHKWNNYCLQQQEEHFCPGEYLLMIFTWILAFFITFFFFSVISFLWESHCPQWFRSPLRLLVSVLSVLLRDLFSCSLCYKAHYNILTSKHRITMVVWRACGICVLQFFKKWPK